MPTLNVTFKNQLNMIRSRVADALNDAADELKETAVEWVQEKMLYGYHDPHGDDRHTEIYWTDRETGEHMIDTIASEVQRNSQDSYTVEVGSPKKYAVFVHNGTRKLKGRKFLYDAMQEHAGDVEKIMRRHAERIGR